MDGEAETARRVASLPAPTPADGAIFVEAHHAAREVLRERTDARVGWSVACQALTPTEGNEEKYAEVRWAWEDLYLDAARGDDFIGVQSYSSQPVDETGVVPHPEHPDNTLTGAAYRPDAIGIAVRQAAEVTGLPVLVTENGIATHDDDRRIQYTASALDSLGEAMRDGVDVRGYLHWSLLDNYEWGHWDPTFGLIAVDRTTFQRTVKPSAKWLGEIARANAL